jgi:hypothetical protein
VLRAGLLTVKDLALQTTHPSAYREGLMIDVATISFLSTVLTILLLAVLQINILRSKLAGPARYSPAILAVAVVVTYLVLRLTGVFLPQRPALGGREDALVLLVIFIGVVAGIVANRLMEFGVTGKIRWQSVLIPLVISPLVVAPVWSMYDNLAVPIPGFRHYVSFAFSGFTSGYSFRSIIGKMRPTG